MFKQKKRANATLTTYDDTLRLRVVPGVGSLRIRELTVGTAERFLNAVRDKTEPSAAKHAKTVLSQAMGLAARHAAVEHNPLRNVSPITTEKELARALTLDEVRKLRAGLRAYERAWHGTSQISWTSCSGRGCGSARRWQ